MFQTKRVSKSIEELESNCPAKLSGEQLVGSQTYRPICLLNVLEKIFDRTIVSRLEKRRKLDQSEMQFGFRKGRSTQDAINRLLEFIDQSGVEYKYAAGLFVDISEAFDNV